MLAYSGLEPVGWAGPAGPTPDPPGGLRSLQQVHGWRHSQAVHTRPQVSLGNILRELF
jgi:hypothetical protein